MNVLTQCREKCKPSLKKIVFADSLDIRLIQAANELQKQGLAEPILIGNPFELRDLAHQTGVVMPTLAVVDPLQSHLRPISRKIKKPIAIALRRLCVTLCFTLQ